MNTEYNPTDHNPMDPALEQAVSDIRDEVLDSAVIEAAAARVWANLLTEANAEAKTHAVHSIRGCADFQALIPGLKAGRLPQARATLLKDHLHECVDCRRIYEGRVVGMPVQGASRRNSRNTHSVRWAVAAVVVAAAGLSVWVAVDQYGTHTGRAFVQTVNGTLYEILPSGIHPLAPGQDLRDGIEIRTGKDSDAMLELRDGSVVELRERSGFSTTQTAGDLTIRLERGSVIVQAAKRRSSHLYVATADCRVAVTGTLFSVSSGLKGSRVSVIEGEVRVSQNGVSQANGPQDNREQVLHPGDQVVTSPNLEPVSVKDDIAWSRNRDRMVKQLELLRAGLAQLHLPELRYSSRLLDRLPASTVFFASIPNLAAYLGQAQGVFRQKMSESPELRAWWAGHGIDVEPVMERLRAASEYLGDEIVIAGFSGPDGKMQMPVFLAEVKREGFAEFVKKEGAPFVTETRSGMVAFSPNRAAVSAFAPTLDAATGGFAGTPFHARIADSYRDGAGLLLCADLSQITQRAQMSRMGSKGPLTGARYFIAEEKEVNRKMEARLSIGFDGPRTGIASWLASPSSMGTLDYVSPEATLVTAFVVKNPTAIVDELLAVHQRSAAAAESALADARQRTGIDVRNDLAAGMGGEFSLSLDGPAFPVPSWKLVTEVYDPLRIQATFQKLVETYNQETVKAGGKPLRTSQEVVEGRTYYMIAAAEPNPLTEAHYTFADGYLIAGPTRALVGRALQVKTAGTSIAHSASFMAMVPRDHYANFSALIYQNLGATLAPVIGLLGAFAPAGIAGNGAQPNPLQGLGNMKPALIAAYGEPDRISVATSGDLMGMSLTNLMTGNLQSALPFSQFMGTRGRAPAFK